MRLTLPPPRPDAAFPVLSRDRLAPAHLRGGVVAIGNFDGVHRGHRHVVGTAIAEARQQGVPALALTFEPHPRQHFQPDIPLFRLSDPPGKVRLLAALGLDAVAVATFDTDFAALDAAAFATEVLAGWLGASHVLVGADFRYGAGRTGDVAVLQAAGARHGFALTVCEGLADGGVVISSTAIRAALESGDVATAGRLLGHAWFVTGEVIHGEKRGRDLGYRTANLRLDPALALSHGIYAVRLGLDGVWHDAVASFGRRPTFDNGAPLLETHVFDAHLDLYGREVDIAFFGRIRPELKFTDVGALIAQMDRDSRDARAVLASHAT
ncbi:bifunctional riboflavin kinase/FAD synthetase [Phreatobacter sp.]|uniref:bifunctional riboflavin kinase/FAD synthetase n=1 Tax=Phreatobacter sp. TaxID=1966341 RepID=UPI003F72AC2D